MGVLYFENSQYPQAEQAWLKSERISGNFRYLPINNLARLYLNWGKFKETEEYMEKADKLAHGRGATKSISAPYYYFNKATYEQLKGDYAASEKDYDKAIEGIQKLVAKTHLYYTIVLSGKADLYVSQSRFEEAEKEIRTILDTRKKNLGEENPQTAQAMVLLANVLADQGKYAEARQYAARAIEVNNIIFEGKENLFVANARHSLGNIKRQEGRYEEASQLLKEALAMEESVLGADHLSVARTKRDLARVYLDQNSYPEAEKLLLSSNSIIEARTGQDHPERARSHRDLGNLYLREGLYDKAEGHFLKALTLARAALGENNQVTADSARDLGDLYSKKENYEKAVEYISVAQNIDKAVFGENAPQVAADLMALATAYDALGQGSRATPLIEQAQQIKQKLDGGAVVTKPELQIPVAFTPLENQPIQNKWALAIGIS
ncbi:MAG TPA: tetratricopeptide repeat protein, partial [Candidatus Melainabacteria bacterium]|nr:tetratricopeptide repeat protein [Candidatus Melainabacteria bacterium]